MSSSNATGYRGMDREELDYQYAPSKWSIRNDTIKQHCDILCEGSESQRALHNGRSEINTPFASVSPNTTVDILYPDVVTRDTPVSIYIHGGYWVLLSKEDSSWFASSVTSAGAIHVAVGYDLCPSVSLTEIVRQVRLCVAWVARKFPGQRLVLSGHSAGGHLAAMVMCTDWDALEEDSSSSFSTADPAIAINSSKKDKTHHPLISGACLVSGVFDLEPIRLSENNDPVKLTSQEAAANSPMRLVHLLHPGTKIVVAVGERDSPEFRRLSSEYAARLQEGGHDTTFVDVQGVDHFDVIERLQESDYVLTQHLKELLSPPPSSASSSSSASC